MWAEANNTVATITAAVLVGSRRNKRSRKKSCKRNCWSSAHSKYAKKRGAADTRGKKGCNTCIWAAIHTAMTAVSTANPAIQIDRRSSDGRNPSVRASWPEAIMADTTQASVIQNSQPCAGFGVQSARRTMPYVMETSKKSRDFSFAVHGAGDVRLACRPIR